MEKVAIGELPFLLTSCCPSWAVMAREIFPDLIDQISREAFPWWTTQEQSSRKIQMQG
ncbi:MAG: [Fe-Fe] hydrogenase large subunit C-terminal domain-containing protein [Muricomes sp.]